MGFYREVPVIVASENLVTEAGSIDKFSTFLDEINPSHTQMMICLNVTAVTGTNPRMDMLITMDIEGETGPIKHELGQFRRLTKVEHRYMLVQASLKHISISYTISGGDSPSFRFGMTTIRL